MFRCYDGYDLKKFPLVKRLCLFLFLGGLLPLYPIQAQTLSEQAQTVSDEVLADETQGQDADILAREVILQHPQITSAAARACRSNYSLNLTKSRNLPQISGSLEGSNALVSSIDYDDVNEDQKVRGRAFNKNAYNNAIDVVLSLDKNLWDAGKLNFDISADEFDYRANLLRREENMSQLLLDLLITSANLEYANRRVSYYKALIEEMTPHIETIEARVEAGVVRFELLRQVKIVALDAEFELRSAENDLFLAQQNLTGQFNLSAQNGAAIFEFFTQNRNSDFAPIHAERALAVRILDLEAQRATAQNKSIAAEKKPQFSLSFDTRFFDVSSFGQDYEIVGNIGVTMPLYDGGANKARQQQTAQSIREARSQRRAEILDINNDYQRFSQTLNDNQKIITQLEEKWAAQSERKESLLAIADRADVSVLELVRLMFELSETSILLNKIALDNEILFARRMHQADELLLALGFSRGDVTC